MPQDRGIEAVEFFAGQRGERAAIKRRAHENAPTGGSEVPRGDEGVTGVVAFAGVDEKEPGAREKLRDEPGKFGPNAFHEHIGGNPSSEGLPFEALHLFASHQHECVLNPSPPEVTIARGRRSASGNLTPWCAGRRRWH